jgi:hypothetical protein
MSEKFDLIKEVLMDMRNDYADRKDAFIEGALGNGDINEDEAAELKSSF